MRVLVTGASGFVGRAIVGELTAWGHAVIGTSGPRTFPASNGHGPIELIPTDIGDAASLAILTDQGPIDAVVHAAGIAHRFGKVDDSDYQRINVDGVRNVADVSAKLGAKRLILISSVLVYGRSGRIKGRPVEETDECHPADVYARSKFRGEIVATEICRRNGMSLSILRPAPIIGEGSKGNFNRLIAAIDRGRFVWIGDGSNFKSLVYVGDVARTAATVLERSTSSSEVFNVAAPPIKMRAIVAEIASCLGRKVPGVSVPPALIKAPIRLAKITPFSGIGARVSTALDTWLADDIYSSELIAESYGLEHSVSVSEAIKREVEAYLKTK